MNNLIEAELNAPHWKERYQLFENENAPKNGIVFLGNSLTELFAFDSVAGEKIINRGISGDFTFGVLKRLPQVVKLQPRKIFLEIGINDLIERVDGNTILDNIENILDSLQSSLANSKIYLCSLTPTILPDGVLRNSAEQNQEIVEQNIKLKLLAQRKRIPFINLHALFVFNKKLKPEFSTDGIHLTEAAYKLWVKEIETFIRN